MMIIRRYQESDGDFTNMLYPKYDLSTESEWKHGDIWWLIVFSLWLFNIAMENPL